MKTFPALAKRIAYYDPLLCRYARLFIKNNLLIKIIVTQVLEQQYDLDRLQPVPQLRNMLKNAVRQKCLSYVAQQNN